MTKPTRVVLVLETMEEHDLRVVWCEQGRYIMVTKNTLEEAERAKERIFNLWRQLRKWGQLAS